MQAIDILRWVGVAIAAGFLGYFGRYLTMMKLDKALLSSLLILSVCVMATGQMTIGEWRTHLPYSQAIGVTEADDKIYCVTRGGLFYFNKKDNSINKFTKVDGLSDVQINCVNYSHEYDVLVIAYSNANLDLICEHKSLDKGPVLDLEECDHLGN